MKNKIYAQSAGTKYPNTPETDAMSEVMHEVTMSDGTKREIMATDPMDAIDQINRMENNS